MIEDKIVWAKFNEFGVKINLMCELLTQLFCYKYQETLMQQKACEADLKWKNK